MGETPVWQVGGRGAVDVENAEPGRRTLPAASSAKGEAAPWLDWMMGSHAGQKGALAG